MIEFIKIKAKNMLISIIAFLLVSPCLLTDYLFAGDSALKEKVNMANEDMAATKYGGPAMNFDEDIILEKLVELFGVVTSKETKKPVEGIIIKIQDSKAKAVTGKDGMFKFPPCPPRLKKVTLEVKDAKDEKLLQTKEVELKNAGSTIEISL
ncbi:MAG: hypothetical protein QMC67_03965 [Candidatus Wallbacteria bacterium]